MQIPQIQSNQITNNYYNMSLQKKLKTLKDQICKVAFLGVKLELLYRVTTGEKALTTRLTLWSWSLLLEASTLSSSPHQTGPSHGSELWSPKCIALFCISANRPRSPTGQADKILNCKLFSPLLVFVGLAEPDKGFPVVNKRLEIPCGPPLPPL